jgi:hypothetical protein
MTSNFCKSRGTHLADDSKKAEFKAHVVNLFSGSISASLLHEVTLDHDSSLVCSASLSKGKEQPVFLYDSPSQVYVQSAEAALVLERVQERSFKAMSDIGNP